MLPIVALERRLSSDRTSEDTTDDDFTRLPDDLDTFATPDQQAFSDLIPQDARDLFEKEASSSDLAHNFEVDSVFSQLNSAMALPITRLSPVDFISEPMRSDLYVSIASPSQTPAFANHNPHCRSHLYFDRVHSFFPILNKRHYFVRARRSHYEQEDEAFYCLQHAMWTLAVSTSSQFQHIQDDLYAHTHRMIENLEQRYLNAECMRLEQVQARALLTIYEFMRVGYRKAWMSAGKCFRFAMLMKLHNIDGRDGVASLLLQNLTFVEIEERRRTFWMAYTIDRIISLLDRLPVTFDQHTVSRSPVLTQANPCSNSNQRFSPGCPAPKRNSSPTSRPSWISYPARCWYPNPKYHPHSQIRSNLSQYADSCCRISSKALSSMRKA